LSAECCPTWSGLTLRTLKFRGLATIEYEHLSPQLVEDVAKCVKFVETFAASAKT